MVMGGIWNLQAAGRGYAVLGAIIHTGSQALEEALLAGSALAAQDFATSTKHFASSEALLVQAQQELNNALATSRRSLEILDVSGTVKSGTSLLVAGEHLTKAGKHVATGMDPLVRASVTSDGGNDNPTLSTALQIAQAEFTAAQKDLQTASEALDQVTISALPQDIQEPTRRMIEAVTKSDQLLAVFLEQSQVLLAVLGTEREREYLVLLQNNNELRPTGGFIGSLALVHVDQGVVENIAVSSVYDPDGQLHEFIAPPNPLTPITDRWYLRDANWFIDWQVSAGKVAEFFEKEGGNTVDGIIALTPTVIEDLLRVTGPINVPGYDQPIDADSFVSLTQDLVTYSYNKETNDPKRFLSDLTPVLMSKVFSGSGNNAIAVLDSLAQSLAEKQMLLHFKNEQEAKQLTKLGWDAAMPEDASGFLQVNNANIGGHKSDQFIDQELDYRSEVLPSGDVEVVLTIRRTHNGPREALKLPYPTGENPAYKTNISYQRVLVPKGAELLEAKGFASLSDVPRPLDTSVDHNLRADGDVVLGVDSDVAEWQRAISRHANGTEIGEEAGYTMLANWFVVKPGDTVVGLYRYRLPRQAQVPGLLRTAGKYSVYLSKQPGDTRTSVRAEITLPEGSNIEHTVPPDGVTKTATNQLVYRGRLKTDTVIGTVF